MLYKFLVTNMCLIFAFWGNAQFYYKDILTNKQITADLANLKAKKVKLVSLKSFDDDGRPSEGFFCEKRINKNYTVIEMRSSSNVSGSSLLTSYFDKNGLLAKTVDSSDIASSTSVYAYNAQNNIAQVTSILRSSDDDFHSEIREEHIYAYNDSGRLLSMIRIRNLKDSAIILFLPDEKNNIGIEKNTKTDQPYYYYYDENNRLTDIVRMNPISQKLLPDYLFEYDDQGELTQMTTIEDGGSYYFVWRYFYENGLKREEKCFSKEKKLMGRIEYEYK